MLVNYGKEGLFDLYLREGSFDLKFYWIFGVDIYLIELKFIEFL